MIKKRLNQKKKFQKFDYHKLNPKYQLHKKTIDNKLKYICKCGENLEWIGVLDRKYRYSCPKCCTIISLNTKNPNDYYVKIGRKS